MLHLGLSPKFHQMKPWDPTIQLEGSSPSLWLDAAAAYVNGGAAVDGAAVSAWVSRDAGARNFVQATGTKQPIYRSSAINGRPGVDFDGADDIMTIATPVLTGNTGTVVIIYQFDTVASNQTIFSVAFDGDAATWLGLRAGDAAGRGVYDFRNGSGDTLDSGRMDAFNFTSSIPAVATYLSDGSTITGRTNGVAQTFNFTNGTNTGDWFGDITAAVPNVSSIGGRKRSDEGQYFNGKLCELIAYASKLNSDSLSKLANYTSRKYGVAV